MKFQDKVYGDINLRRVKSDRDILCLKDMKKWNELSMADRAKYIKLGVEQGITDINHISSAYNSYAGGGYKGDENNPITLPEQVVTPRVNYTHYTGEETDRPSVNEYIRSRMDEARADAVIGMLNTMTPAIPKVPTQIGRALNKYTGGIIPSTVFGYDKHPFTCIYTATIPYGDDHAVPGNVTLAQNPFKYGFEYTDEPREGDIAQLWDVDVNDKSYPSHAGMVTGFNVKGHPTISQSHGGTDPDDMAYDADYWLDDFGLYNGKEGLRYLTFTGTKKDRDRWRKEYKSLYSTKANKFDTGGPKQSSMERIASIIASDPRFANVNVDAALANYEDSVRERNATQLPEFTITATKPKPKEITYKDINPYVSYEDAVRINAESNPINRTLDYGARNFEHTFGVSPREVGDWLPFVGDALAIGDISRDLNEGNYGSAAVGAGLFALPNVIEKPLKGILRKGYNMFEKGMEVIGDLPPIRTAYDFVNDVYNWKDTAKAIKEGTYIPFMTPSKRKRIINELNTRYQTEVIPASVERHRKNWEALSEKYDMSGRYDLTLPDITFNTYNNGRRWHGLSRNALGENFGNDMFVTINKDGHRHLLASLEDILGTTTHEVAHTSQQILGHDQVLNMRPGYANNVDITYLPKSNKMVFNERMPLVEEGPVHNKGEYFGIPDEFIGDPDLIKDDDGFLRERIGAFDALLKRNENYTWHSAPDEVMSEVADYIDYGTKGNRGKLFNELSDEDKGIVAKKIAKRFNLTEEESMNMLNAASPDYLRNGGNLNRFEGGGFTLHPDNKWADIGLSFVPFYGTAMDIEDAIKDPSIANIGMAGVSLLADLFGASLIKGLYKGGKAVRAFGKLSKAERTKVIKNSVPTKNELSNTKELKEGLKDAFTNKDFYKIMTPAADIELNSLQQYYKYKDDTSAKQDENEVKKK